jgi:hypothetical protein
VNYRPLKRAASGASLGPLPLLSAPRAAPAGRRGLRTSASVVKSILSRTATLCAFVKNFRNAIPLPRPCLTLCCALESRCKGPRGGVVTQRSAKPFTPVQFRAWPPVHDPITAIAGAGETGGLLRFSNPFRPTPRGLPGTPRPSAKGSRPTRTRSRKQEAQKPALSASSRGRSP